MSLSTPSCRQQGISLIELMVGMTVGLIIVLAITGTVATVSNQRKITVSAGNATESAQVALNMLDRAGRMAGAGLFYNGQMICSSINIYYNGAVLANNASFMPAKIIDGGTTGSDKLVFTYSNAIGGASTVHLFKDMPSPSSVFTVNQTGSLKPGDLALVGVPGSSVPCTLFGITQVSTGGGGGICVGSSCSDIDHNSGSSEAGKYNPSNPENVFTVAPAYGINNSPPSTYGPAIIIDLGSVVQDTYEVMCNTLVSHPFNGGTASCTAAPLGFTNATPLVGDVVQIQAQYGISASASSDVVSSWVDATSASGWDNPSASNIPRIKAIRIAVVARSKEPAPTEVSANCSNGNGVTNVGPCSFTDASSPKIDLSATLVPAGMSWKNFRYRVYQTVIPLRNVAWNY